MNNSYEPYVKAAVDGAKAAAAARNIACTQKPSNADEDQSKQICFDTGAALVNEGLVPQFPTNSSPEFFNGFVNSLEPEQQEQLNGSNSQTGSKGSA